MDEDDTGPFTLSGELGVDVEGGGVPIRTSVMG